MFDWLRAQMRACEVCCLMEVSFGHYIDGRVAAKFSLPEFSILMWLLNTIQQGQANKGQTTARCLTDQGLKWELVKTAFPWKSVLSPRWEGGGWIYPTWVQHPNVVAKHYTTGSSKQGTDHRCQMFDNTDNWLSLGTNSLSVCPIA